MALGGGSIWGMTENVHSGSGNLIAMLAQGQDFALAGEGEAMWLDVIHKIDEVYSDLLRYETDLEWKNKELEEAQTFISSVIASVSDILVVVDARAAIQQVNPAFVKLVGQGERDLLGCSMADLIVESDRAIAMLLLIKDGRSDEAQAEFRFLTPDGPSDLMAINCSPRLDHLGRRVGTVLTGRPIGELRRAYEALHTAHTELQHAQRKLIEQEKMASLGRLVAGVAHELNNPISFIYGNVHALDRYRGRLETYLTALQDGAPEAPQLRQSLKIDALMADLAPLIEGTLEGAERVSDIVRNLRRLSFSKGGNSQPIDLDKIIRTASHWAWKSKKSQAEIELALTPEVMANGHEGQIHQVLVNLIDNALDAAKSNAAPKVRVRLTAEGGMAVIAICDNGPGVPPDVRDKIFEPFFTTKTVGEGTGLGLWISYTIIQDHGGSIVVSDHPGGGACFTLTLPRT